LGEGALLSQQSPSFMGTGVTNNVILGSFALSDYRVDLGRSLFLLGLRETGDFFAVWHRN
jgi:hypothetical protein